VLHRAIKPKSVKDLPAEIEITKGMQVMVTDNVETDLDVTNGARGEIVDIILHPDERPLGNEPIAQLEYLPAYILVKMARTRASLLDGLDESVIPVEVESTSFRIKTQVSTGKMMQRTVKRRQFPMTAGYAFTDYRSQGPNNTVCHRRHRTAPKQHTQPIQPLCRTFTELRTIDDMITAGRLMTWD
jgi:hypothetical protein